MVEEFNRRGVMNENTNDLLFASLPKESKEIAKKYSRLIVRGKTDSDVPVVLKTNMENQIDLILSHRKDAGILPKTMNSFSLCLLQLEK